MAILLILLICFAFPHIFAQNEKNLPDVEFLTSTLPEEYDYKDKHESLQYCDSFILDPDEYVMFSNRTAFVAAYSRSYNESFYVLTDNGTLTICVPEGTIEISVFVHEEFLHLSKAGVIVSVLFTFIHLVVFYMVKDLRNLPGCNLAALCLSLMLSYIFMILQSVVPWNDIVPYCIATAILTQFFFLGAHLWMALIAVDVFLSILHATGSLRLTNKSFKTKKFIYNSCIAWGISAAFTVAAVLADNIDGMDPFYKPDFVEGLCWFRKRSSLLVFFAGPIFAIICVNFILFCISACRIFHNRMKTTEDTQLSNLRKSHLMYFRLAVIMGTTWVSGAVAPLLNQVWLWYVFLVMNAFQGLFIFIGFTCSKKVRKFFREKFLGGRRASQQTLSPTFQSYCFYSNSIEKDLDKVVGSNDKSNAIDTIMIHM